MIESLEYFEALTGVNVEDFFQSLFDGDPSLVDHSVAVDDDGLGAGGSGVEPSAEEIVLAENSTEVVTLISEPPREPPREPFVYETINNAGAEEYLAYLENKLKLDLVNLQEFYIAITQGGYEPMGMSADEAREFIEEYQRLLSDIDKLQEMEIPSDKIERTLTLLYQRASQIHGYYTA